jgi:hypothetical protein
MGKFEECWYKFFIKDQVDSAMNPSGTGLFFFGRIFIIASISLGVIDQFG